MNEMMINPSLYGLPYEYFRQTNAYVRVLHASPDAPAVDVYANENIIARQLSYKSFTPYVKVPGGTYNIRVFPAGSTVNPVINTSVNLAPGTITTAAAIGRLADIGLLGVPDTRFATTPGKAYIRFIHLSPNAPAVDITLPNGSLLFSNVAYRGIANYIPVDPGTYTLQARVAGTSQVILNVPNVKVLPNKILSVYAVGLAGGNPPLQVLIPLDGNTYIKNFEDRKSVV